jgi:hypothetical protein
MINKSSGAVHSNEQLMFPLATISNTAVLLSKWDLVYPFCSRNN